jgi:hypothetical protein
MRTIVTETEDTARSTFLCKGGAPVEHPKGTAIRLAFCPTGNNTRNLAPYNKASTFRGGRGYFFQGLNPSRYIMRKVTPIDSAITEAIQETSPVVIAN